MNVVNLVEGNGYASMGEPRPLQWVKFAEAEKPGE